LRRCDPWQLELSPSRPTPRPGPGARALDFRPPAPGAGRGRGFFTSRHDLFDTQTYLGPHGPRLGLPQASMPGQLEGCEVVLHLIGKNPLCHEGLELAARWLWMGHQGSQIPFASREAGNDVADDLVVPARARHRLASESKVGKACTYLSERSFCRPQQIAQHPGSDLRPARGAEPNLDAAVGQICERLARVPGALTHARRDLGSEAHADLLWRATERAERLLDKGLLGELGPRAEALLGQGDFDETIESEAPGLAVAASERSHVERAAVVKYGHGLESVVLDLAAM
jgi:hypothetical protein